jgi:hypothetical protein
MLNRFYGCVKSTFKLAKIRTKVPRPKYHKIFQILDSNGFHWEVDSRLALDRHKILGIGGWSRSLYNFCGNIWKMIGQF